MEGVVLNRGHHTICPKLHVNRVCRSPRLFDTTAEGIFCRKITMDWRLGSMQHPKRQFRNPLILFTSRISVQI